MARRFAGRPKQTHWCATPNCPIAIALAHKYCPRCAAARGEPEVLSLGKEKCDGK